MDPGRTLEREDDFLRLRAGLEVEYDPALPVGHILQLIVDLRLQVIVSHQPLTQRIHAVIGALLVEDAAMPLRANLVLDLLRRRRAHEREIDARSECHPQREVGLVRLDATIELDTRLQVALLDERFLHTLDAVANLEEVVLVFRLDAELLAHSGLVRPGRNDDCQFDDLRLRALSAAWFGTPAEANVVPEVESIGAVFLTNAARLEPAGDVVLGDPDLVVAVGQIGGVDEFKVVGQLLAEREPRARVGFVGDEGRLDPDFAQAGRLLNSASETGPDSSCQIRQNLRLGDLVLLAAHVVERATSDEHRHNVRLGERGS